MDRLLYGRSLLLRLFFLSSSFKMADRAAVLNASQPRVTHPGQVSARSRQVITCAPLFLGFSLRFSKGRHPAAQFCSPLLIWDWPLEPGREKSLQAGRSSWIKSLMSRVLVWLENSTFAAWGCSECNWIWLNPGPHGNSSKPSAKVIEAFKQHECAKSPPHKRPSSTVQT
jgi:hypothetical protein